MIKKSMMLPLCLLMTSCAVIEQTPLYQSITTGKSIQQINQELHSKKEACNSYSASMLTDWERNDFVIVSYNELHYSGWIDEYEKCDTKKADFYRQKLKDKYGIISQQRGQQACQEAERYFKSYENKSLVGYNLQYAETQFAALGKCRDKKYVGEVRQKFNARIEEIKKGEKQADAFADAWADNMRVSACVSNAVDTSFMSYAKAEKVCACFVKQAGVHLVHDSQTEKIWEKCKQ